MNIRINLSINVISTSFYILSQYVSILLDIVSPLNESRPRKFLIPAEYFIDHEKYFYIIILHIAIGTLIVTLSGVATESFSITNALHAFGLFKIASYRMKHILNGINPQICVTKKYAISHKRIIAAVDFHRRAIEFSEELLKTSFERAYLILFVIIVCSASVNLFNEFINGDTHFNTHFIRISYNISNIIYYSNIVILQCNTEWYNAPLKTQKLILFLMQKITKCYKVDAGDMNLSMTVSYFTILYSV
ncbi:hypothetical protein P5V15_004424 [Pogonomyrmex californicus]